MERLLAERGPRRAADTDGARLDGADEIDVGWSEPAGRARPEPTAAATDVSGAADADAPRRWLTFTRAHLAIVGVIATLGVLLAGWAVLRARPVPLPAAAVSFPRAAAVSPSTAADPSAARGTAEPSTGARASPSTLVVHVLGAVKRPGLVQLPEPARVHDAIERAGGLRPGADLGDLNLAQVLSDGQQVVIGQTAQSWEERGGERESKLRGGSGPPPATGTNGPGGTTAQVDLNTATAAGLETLPGVGPVTAAKIIAWREEHGRFTQVSELQEVAGIGPKTYAELAPHCRV